MHKMLNTLITKRCIAMFAKYWINIPKYDFPSMNVVAY